jgi:peroxiredoxin Q/BCP
MDKLSKGDSAPAFELLDQNGKVVKLSDFNGRKLLIYFYPRAMTPGCTIQSCKVRDAKEDLSGLGVDAVGISPDSSERQKKFDGKHNLGFPLLADTEHKAAEAYGVWQQKSIFGKKYMGMVRSSFLVDESGKIINAWYKVSPGATVPNAEKELKK